jgi:hypothetical protein
MTTSPRANPLAVFARIATLPGLLLSNCMAPRNQLFRSGFENQSRVVIPGHGLTQARGLVIMGCAVAQPRFHAFLLFLDPLSGRQRLLAPNSRSRFIRVSLAIVLDPARGSSNSIS